MVINNKNQINERILYLLNVLKNKEHKFVEIKKQETQINERILYLLSQLKNRFQKETLINVENAYKKTEFPIEETHVDEPVKIPVDDTNKNQINERIIYLLNQLKNRFQGREISKKLHDAKETTKLDNEKSQLMDMEKKIANILEIRRKLNIKEQQPKIQPYSIDDLKKKEELNEKIDEIQNERQKLQDEREKLQVEPEKIIEEQQQSVIIREEPIIEDSIMHELVAASVVTSYIKDNEKIQNDTDIIRLLNIALEILNFKDVQEKPETFLDTTEEINIEDLQEKPETNLDTTEETPPPLIDTEYENIIKIALDCLTEYNIIENEKLQLKMNEELIELALQLFKKEEDEKMPFENKLIELGLEILKQDSNNGLSIIENTFDMNKEMTDSEKIVFDEIIENDFLNNSDPETIVSHDKSQEWLNILKELLNAKIESQKKLLIENENNKKSLKKLINNENKITGEEESDIANIPDTLDKHAENISKDIYDTSRLNEIIELLRQEISQGENIIDRKIVETALDTIGQTNLLNEYKECLDAIPKNEKTTDELITETSLKILEQNKILKKTEEIDIIKLGTDILKIYSEQHIISNLEGNDKILFNYLASLRANVSKFLHFFKKKEKPTPSGNVIPLGVPTNSSISANASGLLNGIGKNATNLLWYLTGKTLQNMEGIKTIKITELGKKLIGKIREPIFKPNTIKFKMNETYALIEILHLLLKILKIMGAHFENDDENLDIKDNLKIKIIEIKEAILLLKQEMINSINTLKMKGGANGEDVELLKLSTDIIGNMNKTIPVEREDTILMKVKKQVTIVSEFVSENIDIIQTNYEIKAFISNTLDLLIIYKENDIITYLNKLIKLIEQLILQQKREKEIENEVDEPLDAGICGKGIRNDDEKIIGRLEDKCLYYDIVKNEMREADISTLENTSETKKNDTK